MEANKNKHFTNDKISRYTKNSTLLMIRYPDILENIVDIIKTNEKQNRQKVFI